MPSYLEKARRYLPAVGIFLTLALALFIVALAAERGVRATRTFALCVALLWLVLQPEELKNCTKKRAVFLLLCFPLISCVSWFSDDLTGSIRKPLNWLVAYVIGYVAIRKDRELAVHQLIIFPLALLVTLSATFASAWLFGDVNALFADVGIQTYTSSHNRVAFIAMQCFAVCLGLLLTEYGRRRLVLLLFLAAGSIVVCWLGQSRSGFFAALGILCLFAFALLLRSPRRGFLFFAGCGAIVTAILICVDNRLSQTFHRGTDFLLNGRWDIWTAAWETFQKSPIWGHGLDGFESSLATLLAQPENATRFPDIRNQYVFSNPHQLILGILNDFGVVGLLLFCILMALSLRAALKRYPLCTPMLFMLIGHIIHGLGGYGLHRELNSAYFFLPVGMLIALAHTEVFTDAGACVKKNTPTAQEQ